MKQKAKTPPPPQNATALLFYTNFVTVPKIIPSTAIKNMPFLYSFLLKPTFQQYNYENKQWQKVKLENRLKEKKNLEISSSISEINVKD